MEKVSSAKMKPDEKKEYDIAALKTLERIKQADISLVESIEPSEMLDMDLRLRNGKDHEDDKFIIDGIEIIIHQLSFIHLRVATRESMKKLDGTELGKKLVNSMRVESKKDEYELSFSEKLDIESMTDIEDSWLIFFTLKEGKHPRIIGDYEVDKKYFEYLPEAEALITEIRRVNGLSGGNQSPVPSGEDAVKSFHDDRLGSGIEGGVDKDKLQDV